MEWSIQLGKGGDIFHQRYSFSVSMWKSDAWCNAHHMSINTSSSQEQLTFNFKKVTKNIFSEIIPALLHVFKGFTRSEFKWANYSLWDASRPAVIHMLETTLCYSFIIHLLLFALIFLWLSANESGSESIFICELGKSRFWRKKKRGSR